MDEIITDAELHEADEWIEGLRMQASIAQVRAPQLLLISWALLELKIRRAVERDPLTTHSLAPSSPVVADAGNRSS